MLFLIPIVYLNYTLYFDPTFEITSNGTYNKDVYHQLQFLKTEMKKGAGAEMQTYFPEGFIFINALYGLSWCNTIEHLTTQSSVFNEGIKEINWTIREVQSDRGKLIFDADLPLSYGAFYKGWTNYLLGKKLLLQPPELRNPAEELQFKTTAKEIAITFELSSTPYLESYGGYSWPADATIAMASLSLHDKIYTTAYDTTIHRWIENIKQNLDPKTGLIPHQSDYQTGNTIEGARGSSQSLILNFLLDIDSTFAQSQFALYKKHFLDYRFGLPGIREYPKGTTGNGDIDSGPVLLDIGGAASIVGQSTFYKFMHYDQSQGMRNAIEGFGIAHTRNNQKKYLLGKLAIADAFICWSNSFEQNDLKHSSWWRLKFQLSSIFILSIGIFILYKL